MISDELIKKLNSIRLEDSQKLLRKVIIEYDNISGGKYEGETNEKGQFHGYGIYTDKIGLGRRYEGQHRNGLRCGYGIEISHKGFKYEGEFKNDQPNGQGTYTFPNGKKYEGEFKDGEQNGQGTTTFPNGSKYVGEFKDGLKHGHGTFTSSDGRKYEGKWKDGEKHGREIGNL